VAAIITQVEHSQEAEVEVDTHMAVVVAPITRGLAIGLAIGLPDQTAQILQVKIHVVIMVTHTHGRCVMPIPMGLTFGQDFRPEDKILEANDVEDSMEDVEMEVVQMTPTKMMPLVTMQAIWQLIMQPQFKQVRQVQPPS
jgi:hypothetical protein